MAYQGFKISFILFFIIAIFPLSAQEQKGEVKIGKTINGEIGPGQKHRFTLKLKKDQNANLKLIQAGVDLIVITYDPANKKLEEFDSPNGRSGPEYITISSKQKGEYIIEISPLDKNEPKGKYELGILKIKSKAKTPFGLTIFLEHFLVNLGRHIKLGCKINPIYHGKNS